jgi:hypothetical protein
LFIFLWFKYSFIWLDVERVRNSLVYCCDVINRLRRSWSYFAFRFFVKFPKELRFFYCQYVQSINLYVLSVLT